mgnify:CR=1 FL=1
MPRLLEGTPARARHIYPDFIAFIREAVREVRDKGHSVELAGIFYHLGENDMSFGPYRKNAATWLQSTVKQSRTDLGLPGLQWFVSQQEPTDDERVNKIDVVTAIAEIAAADNQFNHIKAFNLPPQEKKLVITTAGIVELGSLIAERYLETR